MAGDAPHEFVLAPLGKRHERASFSCGVLSLDTYLKTQASQDMRRKANAVFVMAPADDPAQIVGYFSLCAYTIGQTEVPEAARQFIPRYPVVSAILIGRLAVDAQHQGQASARSCSHGAAQGLREYRRGRVVDGRGRCTG